MPEQLLHGAQVGTAVEQVGGRGVPQRVRAGRPAAGQLAQQARDELVHGPGAHRGATRAEEHEIGRLLGARGQHGSCLAEVRVEGVRRGHAERHHPLFAALAEHAHREPAAVDVGGAQSGEFADAQGAGVEQLDDGEVAHGDRVPGVGSVGETFENPVHLRAGEHPRQVLVGTRGLQACPRVGSGGRRW